MLSIEPQGSLPVVLTAVLDQARVLPDRTLLSSRAKHSPSQ